MSVWNLFLPSIFYIKSLKSKDKVVSITAVEFKVGGLLNGFGYIPWTD